MSFDFILPHLALIIGVVLAAFAIAHMLKQRRSPAGTTAWLLAIVLLPYVGVPLYLMLGGRKMQRESSRKTDISLHDSNAVAAASATPIDRLLRSYEIPGASSGNQVELSLTGERAYSDLVALRDSARESLWVMTYILHPDHVGKDIIARLAAKAASGVEVRCLLDDVGSLKTTRRDLAPLTDAGGRVAYFMPVFHRPFRGHTNLRNHRKVVIVDQRCVIAGGRNIAKQYIGPDPNPARWRDLSFVLQGPAVRSFAELFRSDWEFCSGEALRLRPRTSAEPAPGQAVVQIVPSGPDVPGDPLYAAVLSMVFAARERLWIASPYFVPTDALSQALSLAAHRGVDVRIMVPEKSNHPTADLARGTYVREIEAAGGRILLYTGPMMHAKALLMDDELAVIGSANMDLRSLFFNYEVAMFVYSEAEVRATSEWMEKCFVHTRVGGGSVGGVRDLAEGVVRMMAPLL